jgi:hypothetical protein
MRLAEKLDWKGLKRVQGQAGAYVNYLNIILYRQLARAALWPPLEYY